MTETFTPAEWRSELGDSSLLLLTVLVMMKSLVAVLLELFTESARHPALVGGVGCPLIAMNGLPGSQTEDRARLRQLTSTLNAIRPVRSRPIHANSTYILLKILPQ